MAEQTTEHEAGAGPCDLGLLVLRLAVGGLLAGHGAQKLFGWYGGHGLEGTGAWLESMGLQPGKSWALMAGLSEFGGGTLTALGLLHPVGPLATLGAMTIAAVDVHGGKPIWVTHGGAELPVTNIAAALALTLCGPGAFSLDHAFGIRMPKAVSTLAALAVAAGVAVAENRPQMGEDQTSPGTNTASAAREDSSTGAAA
jgi:putative oxidoreductase